MEWLIAQYGPEIVLAEYSDSNRAELHKWLQWDSDAFDWTPLIKYVVMELEGQEKSKVEREKGIDLSVHKICYTLQL